MMYLAIKSVSVRNPKRYFTTPGLGDRIHHCTLAWAYGQAHGSKVTLLGTTNHFMGGQFNNKTQSWREIVSLFPVGSIEVIRRDEIIDASDVEWLSFLRKYYPAVQMFWYADHPGEYENPVKVDISPYLKNIPLLKSAVQDIGLPDKFITVQWDSSDRKRTLTEPKRKQVIDWYQQQGYKPVIVGGEAKKRQLAWSLKHIAYAMSKAAFHVGVDSAFFHLAQLYLPLERIHLYNEPDGFYSHHALRAIDNGITFNAGLCHHA